MAVVVTGAKRGTHLNVGALAAGGLHRAHEVRVVFGSAEVLLFNDVGEATHVAGFFSDDFCHFKVRFAALRATLEIDRVAATPHFSGGLGNALDFTEHVFVKSRRDAAGFKHKRGLGRNHVATFAAV